MSARCSRIAVILAGGGALALTPLASSAVFRVDHEQSTSVVANGSSWPLAFRTVQEALAAAVLSPGPDDIWLADGTYFPPDGLLLPPVDLRSASFVLPAGTRILGGFQGQSGPGGGENFEIERNPAAYPTILSGDLADDDLPGFGASSYDDNSRHICSVDVGSGIDPIELHGLRLIGGSATSDLPDPFNVGGALFLQGSGSHDDQSALIVDCRFLGNQSDIAGGAIAGDRTGVEIRRSVFEGNRVRGRLPTGTDAGGGGAVWVDGPLTVTRSRFEGNMCLWSSVSLATSQVGGGAILSDSSTLTVNCLVLGNSTERGDGGGMLCGSGSIANVVFSGNEADGIVDTQDDRLGGDGGGLAAGPLDVHLSTFSNNHAFGYGGGFYGSGSIVNSILWGNTHGAPGGNPILTNPNLAHLPQVAATDALPISYSCVQHWECPNPISNCAGDFVFGSGPDGMPFTADDHLDDPLFLDPFGIDGLPGTADDNLRLSAASPCIDRGLDASPAGVPWDLADVDEDQVFGPGVELPWDFDRVSRKFDFIPGGALVDLGAYEKRDCPANPLCPADLDGNGVVDGADLGILLAGWGTANGDLDCNGMVDGGDLGILLASWGECEALGEAMEGGWPASGDDEVVGDEWLAGGGEETPETMAMTLGFESVAELAEWLAGLEHSAMELLLELWLGGGA